MSLSDNGTDSVARVVRGVLNEGATRNAAWVSGLTLHVAMQDSQGKVEFLVLEIGQSFDGSPHNESSEMSEFDLLKLIVAFRPGYQ